MQHENVTEDKKDFAAPYKAKLGLWMFLVYTIVYAGFIVITAFSPETMGLDIGSINLAIFYGLFLIGFAVILALVYNFLCARCEKRMNVEEEEEEAAK
ncbi:MAG TPA: DUF485 domain-containing protein [Candidatus Limiplasma sp.]|nr:DUF485 domain-containing protein [Candidatus Limiplasma sp.]HRX08538.1 DUF485 domain-containing protein [Candidatus Limiplasma sp.]